MEEAAAVRGAALDAVGDVEPDRLRDRIRGRLEDGSMAPGVLTVLSARAARDRAAGAVDGPGEGSLPGDAVHERAAGVQLIYDGLRLTRSLAHASPWDRTDGSIPDDAAGNGAGVAANGAGEPTDDALLDADLAILVADILVARGFYLLARTEAAEEAVETVRAFGRDQTTRRTAGDPTLDRDLEADVFELAVVAGTTAVGAAPSPALREYVDELARTDGQLPVAEGLFSESTVEALSTRLSEDAVDVATSADS